VRRICMPTSFHDTGRRSTLGEQRVVFDAR